MISQEYLDWANSYHAFIRCDKCGAKYYYKGIWSNSHSCPKCGVSHEDLYNCTVFRGKVNPKKYVYPDFKDAQRLATKEDST